MKRRCRRALVALLLPVLAGCVTVEATLRDDGSGTLEMRYLTPADATEFLQRRQFSSPHVHVDSVKIYESQRTVLRATVDDATKLSTAPGFAAAEIRRGRDDGEEWLEIRLRNPKPSAVPQRDEAAWMRIGLTVPGEIRRAGHDGVVSGRHVAWTIARGEYARRETTVLAVRWRPPAAS